MKMTLTRQTTMLIGIAILAAVLWRLELEAHGWDGLDWIGYFHWAVPVGVALFLGWLFLFIPTTNMTKRCAFVLTAAVASVVWFLVVQAALFYHFDRGPSAFVQRLAMGEKSYRLYKNLFYAIYAVVPLTPLLFAGLLFVFGLKPRIGRIALATLVYVLACPISVGILAVLQHRGGADAIHTIKSGVIIPFFVLGLGLLVPRRGTGQHPAAPYLEPPARSPQG